MKLALCLLVIALGALNGCASVVGGGQGESAADQAIASSEAPQALPDAISEEARPGFDQESSQALNV